MNIRVWNTLGVVRDISAGRLSEAETFGYFVSLSLLWLADSYLAFFVTPELRWSLLYEFVVVVVITLVGLRTCYLVNGGENGKDFVLRFICISFPIEVKLSLIGWTLVVIVYRYPNVLVDPAVFADPERAWNLITYFWVAVFSSVFYWRVWHHMRLIPGTQPSAPADGPASLRSAGRG